MSQQVNMPYLLREDRNIDSHLCGSSAANTHSISTKSLNVEWTKVDRYNRNQLEASSTWLYLMPSFFLLAISSIMCGGCLPRARQQKKRTY
jgi:hypothetical protein